MKRLAPALLALLIGGTSFGAQYSQPFTAANGTTDLGDGTTIGSTNGVAQIQNNALLLTNTATGNTRSSFRIPALANSSLGWTATFDVTMTDAVGGNPPADGFTFTYGAIPGLSTNDAAATGHGAAEAGMGSGNEISFQVDTWRNGDANAPGVAILLNGAVLGGSRLDGTVVPNDGSVSGQVSITWDPVNASFTTTGLGTNANFSGVPHGFTGDDSFSWAFSARTGGATEDLIIDNLVITTVPEPSSLLLGALGLPLLLRRRRS